MSNINKGIQFAEVEERRTARCPAMCASKFDAIRLVNCAKGANRAIIAVCDRIKECLFDKVFVNTNKGVRAMSIFDIYNIGMPDEYLNTDGKITIRCENKEYTLNKSAAIGARQNTRPTRELYNEQSPVLGQRSVAMQIIKEVFAQENGSMVEIPPTFWNESVCAEIDKMMKGYAQRVSLISKKINGHSDSKWAESIRIVIKKTNYGVLEAGIIARVLLNVGPQPNKAINDEFPDLGKVFGKDNNRIFKTKIEGDEVNISYDSFSRLIPQANEVYRNAFREFKRLVCEHIPKPQENRPLVVPKIVVARESNIDSTFFDWKVTLRDIPGGSVNMYVRSHSDKGTSYYPKNLFAVTSEEPKGTLVFNDTVDVENMICDDLQHPGKVSMMLNIPYKIKCCKPVFNKDSIKYIDLSRTIGIDAGLAVAGLVTTVPGATIGRDMMDWHEAIHAYKSECPGAKLFVNTMSKTTRDDLHRLSAEYETGQYNFIAMLTIALRDGAPADKQHNWVPSCDPCAPMFNWLRYRKNADGTPFYSDRQKLIIGHTKCWRKFIRQLIANRRHYFAEQAEWDRTHEPLNEVFSKCSTLAHFLNNEYDRLNNKIMAAGTDLLSNELLNSEAARNASIIAMENLNLNEIEKTTKFRTLYTTVSRDWHMGASDGCRVTSSRTSNTAVIDFGRIVTRDEIMTLCKETPHWHIPCGIKIDGTIVTLTCEPTDEGIRCRDSEWADHYLKNAMHLALVKHDVERIGTRKGILYKEVSATKTSQTCHACGYGKCAKKELKLSIEQCIAKKLNYRDGRKFVCGNPNCNMHGKMQNADVNAAFCIRNRVKFKDSEFAKSLSDK